MTKKYYQTLGVGEKATPEDIKKSYRKLAQQWHPDKWNDKGLKERKRANEMMQEINKVYEILSDAEKRKRYDSGLTDFPADDFNCQYDPKEEVRKQEEELRRREIHIIDLELEILKLEMKALDRSSTLNEISAALCFTWPRVHAEDLDPILWQTYQNWGEKVAKMEITIPKGKDRSEELKNFKEEMVKAIKEAEVNLKVREENKKKSENDSELNQARTAAFGYIKKEMNKKGLKVKDLGQYSNYQERINSLGEVQEIRNFRDEVLKYILKLARKEPETRFPDRTDFPKPEPQKVPNRWDEPRGRIKKDKTDNFLSGIRGSKYDNLTHQELVDEIKQKQLNNASLQKLISVLETRNKELEEDNKALKLKVAASKLLVIIVVVGMVALLSLVVFVRWARSKIKKNQPTMSSNKIHRTICE
ncbi:J domain-containing protein [endosymbiont GvMRE of Glomus versiforme]|uniref:J domain-containing protein n=1 Tax=endosymbiont GvMRE of Glomus versiforme TaxID=2039283 RepID=UPI000EE26827|nr:DnaJ domain-containing protein [endosymbiont GvMRE of Glomus versiforme]RHZ35299.1 Chaperone protein DnaJ [endosymbiont GvMRE of Glomus versiforme]